jgi:hypothetical protein
VRRADGTVVEMDNSRAARLAYAARFERVGPVQCGFPTKGGWPCHIRVERPGARCKIHAVYCGLPCKDGHACRSRKPCWTHDPPLGPTPKQVRRASRLAAAAADTRRLGATGVARARTNPNRAAPTTRRRDAR